MIFRHQCRSLLPAKSTPCRSIRILPLVSRRTLHGTLSRRKDFEEDEGPDAESKSNLEHRETDSLNSIRQQADESSHDGSSFEESDRTTRTISSGRQTFEDIDKSMTPKELGLGTIRRKQKREFVRWVKQEGSRYEHFPQYIVEALEAKRIEKARKASEDRMFQHMNQFYSTLSVEEILEQKLKGEKRLNKRTKHKEPTPFQQILAGEIKTELTPKQIESRVLYLLKESSPTVHSLYQKYIDWCDYQLQKRTLWFSLPDRVPYADAVSRIQGHETGVELDEAKEPGEDLANYFGPRIPKGATFPIRPRDHSHYLQFSNATPFTTNEQFKPWRPISHETRLRMFDAWREGLGLRNVAWMGGISWRRTDGIIGILKREWEFVEKGGKLEYEMADYMESLLGQTPLVNPLHKKVFLGQHHDFGLFPIISGERKEMTTDAAKTQDESEARTRVKEENTQSIPSTLEPSDERTDSIPLADPKTEVVPGEYVGRPCPIPDGEIIIRPQETRGPQFNKRAYELYHEELKKANQNDRHWEASQKEPLVEVPIKRTKSYFALIHEMEEYDQKRAAKALSGLDGKTMDEKEEGIKLFERFFGGLRSLGERERYQGTPPWQRQISERQRRQIAKENKNLARKALRNPERLLSVTTLTPANSLSLSNSTDMTAAPVIAKKDRKERVIWRFEDVSWVKQRTVRPRKRSYAGMLDHRARLESGVSRYGPFGIGSGIEGVGGVKGVFERGLDGEVRLGPPIPEKKKAVRDIVV